MSDYTMGLLAKSNAVAAEPYQAYTNPDGTLAQRVAGFTPDQQAAFGQTRTMQGMWQPGMTAATGYTNTAGGVNQMAAANPWMQQAGGMNPTGAASGYLGAAGAQNPFGAAQPYTNAASQTFTGTTPQQYMNPYMQGVLDRLGDQAGRNLSENLMPAIGDQFIKSGQFGSSRMQEITGRALRDTQDALLGQQSQALQQGYAQAGQQFGQDMSRQTQLAGQQGQLGLGYMGALGQLGSTAGNLAMGQMGQYGNLAQLSGNLANQFANTQLQTGQQAGNLAQMQQMLGIRDTAALEAVGAQQQGLDQKNLDVAYQDFLNQTYYPQQQLGFLSNMLRGVPYSSSSSTASSGPASTYTPSGLSQLAGALSLYSALNKTST